MVVLYALFFFLFVSLSNSYDCHSAVSDLKPYLSSKTPYRFLVSEISEVEKYDGCYPEKILGFIRHGARTPGHKLVKQMKYDLLKLKERIYKAIKRNEPKPGLLCLKELENLNAWEPKVDNDDKWLTHEGEDEMIDLAERLQKRFPTLLTQPYSNSSYFFKYTATQRAEQSAKYFTIGLFGHYKTYTINFPEALEEDPILRFYKGCEKWQKTVKKNPRAILELFEFMLSNDMLKTCQEVSKRLGLDYVLTTEDVSYIYSTCTFETAWYRNRPSPWCSVFSESDLEVLSYMRDLKYYLIDGYGHEINYKIACPAIKHTFSYLLSKANDDPPAVFYFTHSGTLLKLISHLGLYNDSFQLTSSLSKEERDKRQWKTSYIDAFATNLVFVSFNCKGENKVLVLHQEKPVVLPGCPENGLCPLYNILTNFRKSLDNCNMSDLCSLSK